MSIRGLIATIFGILFIGGGSWFFYKKYFSPPLAVLFKTQKPEKKSIAKVIHAEGYLEAEGTSNIGSLISARVKKIHVVEGQRVTKGTLLAELENNHGGDTDLREAQARVAKDQAVLNYKKANYKREQALFKAGQLAADAFEKLTMEYEIAQADAQLSQAAYDREKFRLEQTMVYAPRDGVIVYIPVKVGEIFAADVPSNKIFELADNLTTMKARLQIDENKIGDVAIGMQAKITVDAYPDHAPWIGSISNLGLAKVSTTEGKAAYPADVMLKNPNELLRPGMTVHAKLTVAKVKDVLAVPGFVFQLNRKTLQHAAQLLGYAFKALDPAAKKSALAAQPGANIKTLWVQEGKALVEKMVTIGLTDNACFQILAGISDQDDVLVDDMNASDELKRIAKQIAGS
ncbi:efflux RND transporter periplasmic adaptor subunit [Candidatus Dependentiae bacterium]|nr:efflux RND transporter periplasmic adaptor subunit [Candidatus Dependentiae bacterium]